ncbi:MAG TPA: hypothetical protein PKX93_06660, partial [bacterium]|nr:hypothetical protein [bacterium]
MSMKKTVFFFLLTATLVPGQEASLSLTIDSLKGIYLAAPLGEVEQETVSFLQEGFQKFYQVSLPLLSESL